MIPLGSVSAAKSAERAWEPRMTEMTIVPVERLELVLSPRPWPFADQRRDEIAAHFDALRRANPALWNGRVLMLHQHAIGSPVFHGAYFETDFASMLAWRRVGCARTQA